VTLDLEYLAPVAWTTARRSAFCGVAVMFVAGVAYSQGYINADWFRLVWAAAFVVPAWLATTAGLVRVSAWIARRLDRGES